MFRSQRTGDGSDQTRSSYQYVTDSCFVLECQRIKILKIFLCGKFFTEATYQQHSLSFPTASRIFCRTQDNQPFIDPEKYDDKFRSFSPIMLIFELEITLFSAVLPSPVSVKSYLIWVVAWGDSNDCNDIKINRFFVFLLFYIKISNYSVCLMIYT